MSLFRRRGIVNVKMIITEEKILSNIDKIQKLINPNNKKQIIELDDDTFFKDLIESVKIYLAEYPKKKNFPPEVYRAAYALVEYATNLFEENTKQIEDLIRQRESNIIVANELKSILEVVKSKEKNWKESVKELEAKFSEDIIETLSVIGRARVKTTDTYKDSIKLIEARVANLEANLHIEIDMERIEDRSKALSYIGIEIAEALKGIPQPVEAIKPAEAKTLVSETIDQQYVNETRIEVKTSFWQKVKNSKIVRAVKAVLRARVIIELPALPEGRGENV